MKTTLILFTLLSLSSAGFSAPSCMAKNAKGQFVPVPCAVTSVTQSTPSPAPQNPNQMSFLSGSSAVAAATTHPRVIDSAHGCTTEALNSDRLFAYIQKRPWRTCAELIAAGRNH